MKNMRASIYWLIMTFWILLGLISLFVLYQHQQSIREHTRSLAEIHAELAQLNSTQAKLENSQSTLALAIKTESSDSSESSQSKSLSTVTRQRLDQWVDFKRRLSQFSICAYPDEMLPKQVNLRPIKQLEWSLVWQYLKSLVVIRHAQPKIYDCIERMILKQELLFQCQQAQWALLTDDQVSYRKIQSSILSLMKELFSEPLFETRWRAELEVLYA